MVRFAVKLVAVRLTSVGAGTVDEDSEPAVRETVDHDIRGRRP